MNPEMWMVIMPALGWLCFALGGTQISDKIEGQKWIRRFLLPILWGVCIFLAGFAIWQAIVTTILAIGMFHLGYGSKTSWKMRLLTFAGYGIISSPIGLSFWNPITFGLCAILFLLSNTKITSSVFVHKIIEGSWGALIGVQLSYLLAGNGIVWRFIFKII